MQVTTTYTLADGRDVPANSPLARIEREVLTEHIAALRSTPSRQERADLIERIGRGHGPAYRAKLEAAYTADRKSRRASIGLATKDRHD